MADVNVSSVLEALQQIVGQELKPVTYKWLARQYSMPANLAKRILFQFQEQHHGRVSASFLVSGWTKGSPAEHVIRVVDGAAMEGLKTELQQVTSMHVYSVSAPAPLDPVNLWQQDYSQTQELVRDSLAGKDSASVTCFRSNGCSAVHFVPAPAARRPLAVLPDNGGEKAEAQAALPAAAAAAPAVKKSGGKPAPIAAAPAADKPAAVEKAAQPAFAPEKEKEKTSGPAAACAPAKASGGSQKKSGSLASAWSKAPAPKPKAAARAQPAAKAAPAAAASEAADVLEDDEEAVTIACRRGSTKRTRTVGLEDSDEEVEAAPVPEAPAPTPVPDLEAAGAKKGKRKAAGTDESAPSGKKAAGKGKAAQAAAAATTAAKDEEDDGKGEDVVMEALDVAQAAAPVAAASVNGRSIQKVAEPAPVPAVFSAATGASGGGKVRRKVMTTTYNDKGEEVTEEVWEEVDCCTTGASGAAAHPAPQPAPPKPAAGAPKSGGTAAAGAKTSGGATSGKTGKAKAAPVGNQKSISSFFGLKKTT